MRKAKRQVIVPISKDQRAKALEAIWYATVVAEEDDVIGALSLPWQRPQCVFGLLIALAEVDNCFVDPHPLHAALKIARAAMNAAAGEIKLGSDYYDRIHDLRYELSREPIAGTRAALGMLAALECAGKWIANSDGGGHVYNAYIAPFCHHLIWTGEDTDQILDLIERWRFRDAVGSGRDNDMAVVSAFRVAWRSGRYQLAYLLGRGSG